MLSKKNSFDLDRILRLQSFSFSLEFYAENLVQLRINRMVQSAKIEENHRAALSTEWLFDHEPYFYYALLNVPVTAAPTLVTKGFRKQSRLYHSDRHSGKQKDADFDGAMHAIENALRVRFQQINEAYKTLQDTTGQRVLYDAVCAHRFEQKRRFPAAVQLQTIQEEMRFLESRNLSQVRSASVRGEMLRRLLQETFARHEILAYRDAMHAPTKVRMQIEKIFSVKSIGRGMVALPEYLACAMLSNGHASRAQAAHCIEKGTENLFKALFSLYALDVSSTFRLHDSCASAYRCQVRSGSRRAPTLLSEKATSRSHACPEFQSDFRIKIDRASSDKTRKVALTIHPTAGSIHSSTDGAKPRKQPRMLQLAYSWVSHPIKSLGLSQSLALLLRPVTNSVQRVGAHGIAASMLSILWKIKLFSVRKKQFGSKLQWHASLDFDSIKRSATDCVQLGFIHMPQIFWFLWQRLDQALHFHLCNCGSPSTPITRSSGFFTGALSYGSVVLGGGNLTTNFAPVLSRLMSGSIPFAHFDPSYIPTCIQKFLARFGTSTRLCCGSENFFPAHDADLASEDEEVLSCDERMAEMSTSFHPTSCRFDTAPPMQYLRGDCALPPRMRLNTRAAPTECSQFASRRFFGYGDYYAPAYRHVDDANANECLEHAHTALRSSLSARYSAMCSLPKGDVEFSQDYMLHRWFAFWDVGVGFRLSLPVVSVLAMLVVEAWKINSSDAGSEVTNSHQDSDSLLQWIVSRSMQSIASLLMLFEVKLLVRRRDPGDTPDKDRQAIEIPMLASVKSIGTSALLPEVGAACCKSFAQYALAPLVAVHSLCCCVGPIFISAFNAVRCLRYLQKHKESILQHRAFAIDQQRILFDSVGESALRREASLVLPGTEPEACGGLIIRRAVYRVRPRNVLLKIALDRAESHRKAMHKRGLTHASEDTLPPLSLDVTSVLQSLVEKSRLVIHTHVYVDGEPILRRHLFQIVPGFYDIEPTGAEQKELVIDYLFLGKRHRYVYIDGPSAEMEDMICIPQESHRR